MHFMEASSAEIRGTGSSMPIIRDREGHSSRGEKTGLSALDVSQSRRRRTAAGVADHPDRAFRISST